jgi:hypothetical protein
MRPRIVIVGVLVAIGGAILFAVPLPTTYPAHTFFSNPKGEWGENVSAPAIAGGLDQRIQITVRWTTTGGTAGTGDSWRVFDCGYVSKCPDSVFSKPPMFTEIGASGSLAWSAGPGQLFNLAPGVLGVGGNLTVVASYTEPLLGGLVGSVLLVGGAAVVIVGAALPAGPPVGTPTKSERESRSLDEPASES